MQSTVNQLNEQINQLSREKNNLQTDLATTKKQLETISAENSSLRSYIAQLEKARNDAKLTAEKSQQIVDRQVNK